MKPTLHLKFIPSRNSFLAAAIISATVLLLFMTSPRHEDFWWTDAATFALNGELLRDYIASGFTHAPIAFANAWFLRYPALTISLYPPIFPMAEAAMFSVFGFSHPAAQATVAAFTALAAYGAYLTARTALPVLAAAAFTQVLFATPGVMLWSRQVMMEIPSMAFLLFATAALLWYQRTSETRLLFLAVVMVLAAIYTKQTSVFAIFAFAAALLLEEGPALLRRRAIWLAALVGLVGLLPLLFFTLIYASRIIDIALGQGSAAVVGDAPHVPLAALASYARALPDIVGWLPLAGALGYLVFVAARGWRTIAERRLAVLMLAWFVADYMFISLTGHFETRYGMALAVPSALLSVLLIARLTQERWVSISALTAGAVLFAFSLATHPVHWVSGYGAVATAILDDTAQDDVILMDVNDSKSLTFSLRSRSPKPKIYVLRAEKLLVKYSILRAWGINDQNLSTEAIEAMIDHYGISLIALEPGFWTDQPSMARLQSVIYSDKFEQLDEIPISAQDPQQRTVIKIFRNKTPTHPTEQTIRQLEQRI